MDSINDLLSKKTPSEPPQVSALKDYARRNYDVEVSIRVSPKYFLISAPNAALAHKMRVDTVRITEECKLDKRLVIHIGS